MGISVDRFLIEDTRSEMWRHSRRETYARHSEIPATERFDFYLGYHMIFVLASRLLKTTSLAILEDWDTSTFEEWLDSHYLTLEDGNLLADLRSPPPLLRRSWIEQNISESWQWEISRIDFLEGLLARKCERTFICVSGYWSDTKDSYAEENYRVSSSLASNCTSRNLVSALLSCNDFNDYKLPSFGEDKFEVGDAEFNLKGWISQSHSYKKLDESDVHAAELPFPCEEIAEDYLKKLDLKFDALTGNIVDNEGAFCGYRELWTSPRSDDGYQHRFIRQGTRIYVSLEKLKQLCKKSGMDLLFEVQIQRKRSYYSKQEGTPDEVKYPRPYCNLYCFGDNGIIRDQYTSYQLR